MFSKLLVLGRPGSGKTTAFRRISVSMENEGWSVTRIRDYGILQRMFKHDTEGKKFRKADYDGFDVIDFSVLDSALIEVESQVRLRMLSTEAEKELVLIEIARSDYKTELEPFSADFMQDMHILFIDTDVETCIRRIHQRVANGVAADNHFISDHISRGYYGKDNMPYIKSLAKLSSEAQKEENNLVGIVHYIENTESLSNFYTAIDDFVAAVIEQEQRILHLKKLPTPLTAGNKNELVKQ